MVKLPAILFLDTCLLLDVIRAVVRENIGTHDVHAVLTLNARQNASPQSLQFAVTQQVKDEFAEHVDAIEAETARSLDRLVQQTNGMLTSIAAFGTGAALPSPMTIQSQAVTKAVRTVADDILNNCLIVPHSIADSHAALGRVQQARPPATRAKQSIKDCLIIEGVLRYVISERADGRAQRIVFASSNTSDYHQGHGSLHPALRAEFDACDLGFAPSWSAARYEIDRL
ncbi:MULTISPECIES: PIN domain-containing protein [Rhizobium/Agrobacterium group]|uniref:PIN domain-containing protein n=1 Tax=Rhizobium/Agrobacterium group TaxID=227290 RepID=UPI0018D246D1|nr:MULTISPECIES: PIN domain-containing protein [Rhizobium/Agrobacterium group]